MAKKGSGDWFKTIISLKKVKDNSSNKGKGSSASAKSNGFKWKNRLHKETVSRDNQRDLDIPIEDLAATQIQTAFRAYKARKSLRRLKGAVRLQNLTQNYTVKKQATTTLYHLHSWSKMQAEIRSRRQCMVIDGRIRQKRLENQLKLEAKLHDLEIEWSGGSETMEETLSRIHQREEASIKRERAMAYAFSHQWRANSSQYHGLVNYELGKENWGWSWTESWIAARPWETRVLTNSVSPKKEQKKQAKNGAKKTNSPTIAKTPVSSKSSLSNGKGTTMARRLSFPPAEKAAQLGSIKTEEANSKGEQLVS